MKGGGTPNLGFSSSCTGVLGGRGGGGGPVFAAFEDARARFGGGGGSFAYLPASAMGGGALKTGLGGPGGEGCRGGDDGAGLAEEVRLGAGASVLVRLAGGGAGGGPLLEADVPPVFWGLRGVRAPGGGGGGARDLRSAFSACCFSSCFFCSMYSLMKSAFSSI